MAAPATATQSSPLAASLDLVAEEIGELVELGERMQSVISRLAATAPRDADSLVDAQVSDLLSQRLSGLTAFVRALAEAERSSDYAAVETAVSALTLAEQARRLAGVAPARPPEPVEPVTFWD
ncbi:MAG: hypothetical protein AB1942_06550 [Pseudomonadota bacterium]